MITKILRMQLPPKCHLNCVVTYNLHPTKTPGYDFSSLAQPGEAVIAPEFFTAGLASLDSSLQPLLQVILAQCGIQRGLNLFVQRGDEAIKS